MANSRAKIPPKDHPITKHRSTPNRSKSASKSRRWSVISKGTEVRVLPYPRKSGGMVGRRCGRWSFVSKGTEVRVLPYPRKSGAIVWNRFDKCSVKTDIQSPEPGWPCKQRIGNPLPLTETLSFVCDIFLLLDRTK